MLLANYRYNHNYLVKALLERSSWLSVFFQRILEILEFFFVLNYEHYNQLEDEYTAVSLSLCTEHANVVLL